MKFATSVIDIITKRKSVRTYTNTVFSTEILEKVKTILESYSVGYFGNKVTFSLIEKDFAKANQKLKLGTYGFISGAKYFIAGEVKKNDHAFEDCGYLLEKIILHLTELNIGTCWLGGTFSRNEFAVALNSDADTIIPAITPLGYATESKSIKENLIRLGAKADKRKAWSELFYDTNFATLLTNEAAGVFGKPLEMVRWAPSASNKQPWRILKNGNTFHFYLKRTPGYNKYFKEIDLQKIDMGIAMAHFELACEELGLKGHWVINNPFILSRELEYVVSWNIAFDF